jgi:hypothetical protein
MGEVQSVFCRSKRLWIVCNVFYSTVLQPDLLCGPFEVACCCRFRFSARTLSCVASGQSYLRCLTCRWTTLPMTPRAVTSTVETHMHGSISQQRPQSSRSGTHQKRRPCNGCSEGRGCIESFKSYVPVRVEVLAALNRRRTMQTFT